MGNPNSVELVYYGLGLRLRQITESMESLSRATTQEQRATARSQLRTLAHLVETAWARLCEVVVAREDFVAMAAEPMKELLKIAAGSMASRTQQQRLEGACMKLENLICLTAEIGNVERASLWYRMGRELAQIEDRYLASRLEHPRLQETVAGLGVTVDDLCPELSGFGEPCDVLFNREDREAWCRLEKGRSLLETAAASAPADEQCSSVRPPVGPHICWRRGLSQLSVDGQVVRSVRSWAPNVKAILDAFEESGWPDSIPSPWPDYPETTSNAVKAVNVGLTKIKFHVNGEHIRYVALV